MHIQKALKMLNFLKLGFVFSPYRPCDIFIIDFYTFSSNLLIKLLQSVEVRGSQDI